MTNISNIAAETKERFLFLWLFRFSLNPLEKSIKPHWIGMKRRIFFPQQIVNVVQVKSFCFGNRSENSYARAYKHGIQTNETFYIEKKTPTQRRLFYENKTLERHEMEYIRETIWNRCFRTLLPSSHWVIGLKNIMPAYVNLFIAISSHFCSMKIVSVYIVSHDKILCYLHRIWVGTINKRTKQNKTKKLNEYIYK